MTEADQPVKRKRGRPPLHGAYSNKALSEFSAKWRLRIAAALEEVGLREELADTILKERLARVLAIADAINTWLEHAGLFNPEKAQGAVRMLLQSEQAASRIMDELGLTRKARIGLARDAAHARADFAAQLAEAREEEAIEATSVRELSPEEPKMLSGLNTPCQVHGNEHPDYLCARHGAEEVSKAC